MSATVHELPERRRSEIEVTANAVVSLRNAGLLRPDVDPGAIYRATGITPEALRCAIIRADRVTDGRLIPLDLPTRTDHVDPSGTGGPRVNPLPAKVYERDLAPRRGDGRPMTTYTAAGARRAAEAIFAQWRARGNLDCTRCGRPIESGRDVIIEAAHHADGNCARGES